MYSLQDWISSFKETEVLESLSAYRRISESAWTSLLAGARYPSFFTISISIDCRVLKKKCGLIWSWSAFNSLSVFFNCHSFSCMVSILFRTKVKMTRLKIKLYSSSFSASINSPLSSRERVPLSAHQSISSSRSIWWKFLLVRYRLNKRHSTAAARHPMTTQ